MRVPPRQRAVGESRHVDAAQRSEPGIPEFREAEHLPPKPGGRTKLTSALRSGLILLERRGGCDLHAPRVRFSRRERERLFVNAVDGRIRAAVAGDADALTQLLGEHGPEVERSLSIAREWRSVLEPADVMQVTYLEAFLEIRRFDPDRAQPFRSWLQRIAENNLRDAIRGLQRYKRPQPSNRVEAPAGADSTWELYAHLGVTTTTPSRYATREERLTHLDAALETLPDDYGKVIRLYDLQGLPIGEVAEHMNRSSGAIHMLRARAHDRLRELLGSASVWFGTSA
jgi:RNA polymerase sigma-70 factor (ECF subfamily)